MRSLSSFYILLTFSIPFIGAGNLDLHTILQNKTMAALGLKTPIKNLETKIQDALAKDNGVIFKHLRDGRPLPDESGVKNCVVVAHWTYCIETTESCDVATYINGRISPLVKLGNAVDIHTLTKGANGILLATFTEDNAAKRDALISYGGSVIDAFLQKYKQTLQLYDASIKFAGIKGYILKVGLDNPKTYVLCSFLYSPEA